MDIGNLKSEKFQISQTQATPNPEFQTKNKKEIEGNYFLCEKESPFKKINSEYKNEKEVFGKYLKKDFSRDDMSLGHSSVQKKLRELYFHSINHENNYF